MKSNIFLLIIGIIILIISFIISFIFKGKRYYNEKQKRSNEKSNVNYKVENQIIFERIKKLEDEVSILKHENYKLKKDNIILNENNIINDNFKPILNYSVFKEKNSAIIELYKKGKSKEEIARSLNKSIREIEMVIKLVE